MKRTCDEITSYLKDGYKQGRYEPHEIVVALVVMVKDGQVKERHIKSILVEVFGRDLDKMYKALNVARKIVDEEMINEIIKK